ncbi:MAG TPA: Ig-like domain-containing protein, partial [Candidatus Kapabacteria bacterium]|nr:Ig-like domain-containing protein [Candidatus Kapabacteria bacterium]
MSLAVSRHYTLALFVTIALSLGGCAAMAPPPGGPVDTTRPALVSSIPNNRELNIPTNTHISFQFDRDIDRASFIQAFSIQPYLNGIPKYRWLGNDQVRIDLPERLRDSTTYTVQLSRDLKSRRNNTLASPMRVTFSTGPAIDTGILSGFILLPFAGAATKASDIFIFAYDITIHDRDTLNFTHTPPDLLTQPNDQGIWEFLAMKVGHRYRVCAVGDVYRNHVYDPGIDAFGVPAGDVMLDSVVKSNFYIRMSPKVDTIKPELEDVEVVDSFHVRARFSEAIDSNDIHASNFLLKNIPLSAAFRESPDKRPGQVTLLTSAPLAPNASYTLTVNRDSIHDLANNPVSDSAFKITFTVPATLHGVSGPKLPIVGIIDSMRDVSLTPSIPI